MALETLKKISRKSTADEKQFREELLKVARTTISSKLLNYEKEHFAQLAVDAVLRLGSEGTLEHI